MLLGGELHHFAHVLLPSPSKVKNYSVTNFGMSLPLLRKQPNCRQAIPKIYLNTRTIYLRTAALCTRKSL